jgi:hypothetical protein
MAVLDTLKLGGRHQIGPSAVWPSCPCMSATYPGCSVSREGKGDRARPFTRSLLLFSSDSLSLAPISLGLSRSLSCPMPWPSRAGARCCRAPSFPSLPTPAAPLLLPPAIAIGSRRWSAPAWLKPCTKATVLDIKPPWPGRQGSC